MIGMDLPCKVLSPKIVTVDANHNAVKHIVLRLETEFTDDVAAGIGDAAGGALEALRDGGMRSCKLDIGAVRAIVVVGEAKFPEAKGLRATPKIKQTKGDEEPAPTVLLELEAPWSDEALLALVKLCNCNATARIDRQQLSLLDKEPTEAKEE